MQAKFLIGFLLLVTTVLAGGFAGALERVWLWYAYQIDGLNDPADRTLGWKCLSWDQDAEKCRINKKTGEESWVEYKGSMEGRRCTFSEFLNHLGGALPKDQLVADKDGNLLDLKATDPDPMETGKKVYAHYIASSGAIKDYPSYRVLRQAADNYVDCINKVGDAVAKARADGKNTGDNKKLFDRFAETTAQIKIARVGDHGRWLIDAAEKDLNPQGIDVEKERVGLGHSPVDPSKLWETVDWEKTMSGPVNSGKYSQEEMLAITDKTKDGFYAMGTTAFDHKVVIEAFEEAENKARGCT